MPPACKKVPAVVVTYYENCTCPHCKTKLDQVAVTISSCPSCNQPFDPSAVWATRSYPGLIILPRWVSAFGWPFLLIALGAILWIAKSFGYPIPVKLAIIPLAIGLVYFFIKLFSLDN